MAERPTYTPALDPKNRPTGPYTLVNDLRFEVPALHRTAFAPGGFDGFNGASIPPQLWSVIGHPLTREFLRAATVHDALYQNAPGARAANAEGGGPANRDVADRLFHAILLQDGVSKVKARLMYTAVKRFGASRYDKHGAPGLDAEAYRDAVDEAGAVSFGLSDPNAGELPDDLSAEEIEELRLLEAAIHEQCAPPNS